LDESSPQPASTRQEAAARVRAIFWNAIRDASLKRKENMGMGKVGVILSVIDSMLKKKTGAPAKRLSLAFAPVFRQR
jgi:hypothetical protein